MAKPIELNYFDNNFSWTTERIDLKFCECVSLGYLVVHQTKFLIFVSDWVSRSHWCKKKFVTKSCQNNSFWATGWIDLKFFEYVPWIPYYALLLRFYITALKWLGQLNSVLLTKISQKPLNGLIWNFVRMFPRIPSFALYTCLMRNFSSTWE